MRDEQDRYYARDRRMVPEGWGRPLVFIGILLVLLACIVLQQP